MASELCMNCFSVKGQYEVCPYCAYVEGTPPKQPHYLTPGTILGNHFIVGTVIGVGGFGITYKCFDITLGVTVAVKEFYPAGLVNRSPGERQVGLLSGEKREQYTRQLNRFLMEAQSVAQFGKAKDIVNVYDFFEENGTAYIIMEYIDGILLKDYLDRQGAMQPKTAMSIIMPIIQAVKKIHSKGIIHRDISPDNIFIINEESIKIFDFGAAQLNDSQEGMAGEKVIKEGYSAPEQYREAAQQGFYTDIYSVGAILYQMLTGIKPMESTQREFKDELKSPLELGVKISANTDRTVMEALAVKPELRFQGILHLEEALNNKRMAEYPKEKIRKRKRVRNWTIISAVSMVLAVGVAIGLYSTVLKPSNILFDSQVKKGTTFTVWVENEDQKEWLEELKEDGFRNRDKQSDSRDKNDSESKVLSMQKNNEEVDYTVEVKEDMDQALREAKEQGTMPNMFVSDHVSNLSEYNPVSFRDNVYKALSEDEYVYMSEYEKEFSQMNEMPTGLNTLILYHAPVEYHADNKLMMERDLSDDLKGILSKSEEETYDLENLIPLSEDPGVLDIKEWEGYLNPAYAFFESDALAPALVLNNTSWKKVFEKKISPDQEMRTGLVSILSFNQQAKKKKYMLNNATKSEVYGNSIVADVTFRKKMEQLKEKTNAQKRGANPVSDYDVRIVTQKGKMIVVFSERFAITGESSSDQKLACMRLLWVSLTQSGQQKKARNTGEMTYPILETSFYDFVENNRKFGGFIELEKNRNKCEIIGQQTADATRFINGLDMKVIDDEHIQSYCNDFVQEKNK